jgi:hypothetical protein
VAAEHDRSDDRARTEQRPHVRDDASAVVGARGHGVIRLSTGR